MPKPAICAAYSRRLLSQLREEFRAAGRGSLRKTSRELGFDEDYLSAMITRGTLELGVFFAALITLGVDPVKFVEKTIGGERSHFSETPPEATLQVTKSALKRFQAGMEGAR